MVYEKYKHGISHVMMITYIYVYRSLSNSRNSWIIIFMKPDRLVTSNPGSYKQLFCNVTNDADLRPFEVGTIKVLCNKSSFCYVETPDQ